MSETSEHETHVVPDDDAGYEVRCSCGWSQGATRRDVADALAIGHRGYSPDAKVILFRDPAEVTDDQLRDLFARHCECRPLDLTRAEDDHAAIHDCDTAILHDVQVALGIVRFDDIGRFQAMREARARCAEYLALVPNDQGGYTWPTPPKDRT